MEEIKLEIPRTLNDLNPISLSLKNGDQLFIVGENGSGKSALIQQFVGHLPSRFKRITAHRQTWFSTGSIELTPASRQQYQQQNLGYDRRSDARWKDHSPGSKLSAVLFDLVAKENTRARAITQYVDSDNYEKAKAFSEKSSSPFDEINELLSLATLKVKIENSNDRDLLARHLRTEQSFSIAEMSDGERNAMIIAAHVITAEPGTVFLIDEPERHLHRSIIQPFLSALFDRRSHDCAFIIATHEIFLPIVNPNARVLILRSCQWSGSQCVGWDAKVLEPNSQLPEELKRAILGSRNRILFVEGTPTGSLDFPLYTTLFPDISVVPKGSCEDVQKAVFGLRDSQALHHIEAFGLIDRDNRKDEDVKRLEGKGIFALEVYSVEALYYCSDAIAAVASEQARLRGEDSKQLIESAKKESIKILKDHAEEMAAKRCERRIQELTQSYIPNWESIKDNSIQPFSIPDTSQLYSKELARFNKLIEEENLDQLIARYPVRQSCALETIAKSLVCKNRTDYERIVINLIRRDDELAEKLKKRIGPLSKVLESN